MRQIEPQLVQEMVKAGCGPTIINKIFNAPCRFKCPLNGTPNKSFVEMQVSFLMRKYIFRTMADPRLIIMRK